MIISSELEDAPLFKTRSLFAFYISGVGFGFQCISDIRKQLMDKMLVAIMTILDMEGQVNTNKAIVKEINEFLAELKEQIAEKCLVVGGLESK